MKKKVLIIGATGMLGSTMFRALSADRELITYGTIRNTNSKSLFVPELRDALISNINVESEAGLIDAFAVVEPDVVINCVGIIKQLPIATSHLDCLNINSVLPHRIAKYCNLTGARLIHFSTDCVFSGNSGNYTENIIPDALDLYGRSKYLGEIDYGNAITLRTSLIGHELSGCNSLIDWFLSQAAEVRGYKNAIFSGLPTIEIARVVKNHIIPNLSLKGLYHLSVDSINKYDLLSLVCKVYGKKINIIPDEILVIDRSLNSDRFRSETGFKSKTWPELINDMYIDYCNIK